MTAAPFKYTTTIKAQVTAGECMGMLAEHGADAIGFTFGGAFGDNAPDGITFQINTKWGRRGYSLPVKAEAVHQMLKDAADKGQLLRSRGRSISDYTTREHAVNVAWRVLHDWLRVNIALIEIGLAELPEVLLSWQQIAPGRTVFQAVTEAGEQAAIEGARGELPDPLRRAAGPNPQHGRRCPGRLVPALLRPRIPGRPRARRMDREPRQGDQVPEPR